MGKQETLYYAASLVARPEMVSVLYPAGMYGPSSDLQRVLDPTARVIISALAEKGPAWATPGALRAICIDSPVPVDEDDLIEILSSIPQKEEVTLESLTEMKVSVEREFDVQELRAKLIASLNKLDKEETLDTIQTELRNFKSTASDKDYSASAVVNRMLGGQKLTVLYKAFHGVDGGYLVDDQQEGVGPDGEFSSGVLARSQTTVISAMPGTGKTRLMLNLFLSLLEQGGRVGLVAGEDTQAAYLSKLAGMKFDIILADFDRYAIDQQKFLNIFGQERHDKVKDALEWVKTQPIYFWDGEETKVNIFDFKKVKPFVEEQIRLKDLTHVAVDYVQIYKGDTLELEKIAQSWREIASRTNTGFILLSQVANDDQKGEITPGRVPTKGTGDYGQIAHFAYVLERTSTPNELKMIQSKGRNTGINIFYLRQEPTTGRIKELYGTSNYEPVPKEDPRVATNKPRGRR